MVEGRTVEQKRELAQAITKEVSRIAKVGEDKVKIYFHDVKPENVADGGRLRIDKV